MGPFYSPPPILIKIVFPPDFEPTEANLCSSTFPETDTRILIVDYPECYRQGPGATSHPSVVWKRPAMPNPNHYQLDVPVYKVDTRNNPSHSLLRDPLFKHLYDQKEPGDSELSHFAQVITFQEPLNLQYLVDCKEFLEHLKRIEPGPKVPYKKLQEDLIKVQDEVLGGSAMVQKMSEFLESLRGKCTQWILAACTLEAIYMYQKIAFRQYKLFTDDEFCALPELSTEEYKNAFRSSAPPFIQIRANVDKAIETLGEAFNQAGSELIKAKTSIDFRVFTTNFANAYEAHKIKVAQAAEEAKRTNSALDANFLRRLAEVTEKNARMEKYRIKKNSAIKRQNLSNPHQLGNEGRTPLPDHVINWVARAQALNSAVVFGIPDQEEEERILQQPGGWDAEIAREIEMEEGFVNVAPFFTFHPH